MEEYQTNENAEVSINLRQTSTIPCPQPSPSHADVVEMRRQHNSSPVTVLSDKFNCVLRLDSGPKSRRCLFAEPNTSEPPRARSPHRLTRSCTDLELLMRSSTSQVAESEEIRPTHPRPSISYPRGVDMRDALRMRPYKPLLNRTASLLTIGAKRRLATFVGNAPYYETVLPTTKGSHVDINCISCETLKRLIDGEFNDRIQEYFIIDCRYEFEYEGGHIKGAINMPDKDMVVKKFLSSSRLCSGAFSQSSKPVVIVFHCEFSSKRGPTVYVFLTPFDRELYYFPPATCYRYMRECDRQLNCTNYPNLFYPDIYLLEGGYKAFFSKYQEYCEPRAYVEMKDRRFRAKLKTSVGSGFFAKKSRSFCFGSSFDHDDERYALLPIPELLGDIDRLFQIDQESVDTCSSSSTNSMPSTPSNAALSSSVDVNSGTEFATSSSSCGFSQTE